MSADVVLGIFPTGQPQTCDMVDLDDDGRVLRIVIKPRQTHLRYAWIIAVWTPTFTQFLHDYLVAVQETNHQDEMGRDMPPRQELFVGDVIQSAIEAALRVETVLFPDGHYLDIGLPDDLVRAVRDMNQFSGDLREP